MRIVITGSNGLLGQKLVKLCLQRNCDFIATSKGENRNTDCPAGNYLSMDVTNKLEINQVFSSFYPTHVIHTAAITNVDYCEGHQEECHEVNVHATKLLFQATKQFEAHFQLLSTDFVFDGEKGNYKETDFVNPLSVYAKSKVEAENILLNDECTNWSVARTIIVYGEGNNLSRSNIILWAIDTLKKGNEMTIVNDQYRMPTWADDLAWGCLEIARRNKTGIFNLSGPTLYSIYDLILEIANYLEVSTENIKAISSSTLSQAAKRPPRTGFDLTKSRRELDYNPLELRETLDLLLK
jgi:dTDP-4-dehydrorhamnose reductase